MTQAVRMRIEGWVDDPIVRGRVIGFLRALLLIFANRGVALAGDPPPSGGMSEAIANLAKMLIDGIIALSAILLAMGIATNFVTGMVETMVGRPEGLDEVDADRGYRAVLCRRDFHHHDRKHDHRYA